MWYKCYFNVLVRITEVVLHPVRHTTPKESFLKPKGIITRNFPWKNYCTCVTEKIQQTVICDGDQLKKRLFCGFSLSGGPLNGPLLIRWELVSIALASVRHIITGHPQLGLKIDFTHHPKVQCTLKMWSLTMEHAQRIIPRLE